MKNVLFTLFVISVTYLSLFSQSVSCKWIVNSEKGHSLSTDVKVDLDGNMYVTGYFNEMEVEGIYLNAENDHFHIFLGKWDKDGNLIWLKDIGKGDDCRGQQMAINDNGDVILLGSYYQSINIMDSVNYTAIYGGSFILKADKFGNYVWSKNINCNAGYSCDFSAVIDKYDNVLITTSGGISIEGEETIGKSKITKINNSGEIQWGVGTNIDISRVFNERSLRVDENYIYLIGDFKDTIDFAQQTFISSYDKYTNPFDNTVSYGHSLDGIIGRFDLDGNEIDALHFKGVGEVELRTIDLLQNKNIVISGRYKDSLFVQGEKIKGAKAFLALLDSDLSLKKIKNYSSSITFVNSSVSESNFIFLGGGGCSASCIELMDEKLELLQSVNYDNSNTHGEGINALAYNSTNNTLIAAGHYIDEAHFSNCHAPGSPNGAHKIYAVGFEFDLNVNIESNPLNEEYTIFPNPTDGEIFWDIEANERDKIKNIRIYDISGKELDSIPIISSQQKINLSSYPAGIYWIQIETSNGYTSSHKVAKM